MYYMLVYGRSERHMLIILNTVIQYKYNTIITYM